MITGSCDGDISIEEQTDNLTLIYAIGGLASTGSIVINNSEGNFNAGGTIVIGSLTGNPVTADYDGCIHIMDESGTGNGGDLDGRVRIAVCDDEGSLDPNFDHNLCVDGSVNGTISIPNSTCTNQPSYPCGTCTP